MGYGPTSGAEQPVAKGREALEVITRKFVRLDVSRTKHVNAQTFHVLLKIARSFWRSFDQPRGATNQQTMQHVEIQLTLKRSLFCQMIRWYQFVSVLGVWGAVCQILYVEVLYIRIGMPQWATYKHYNFRVLLHWITPITLINVLLNRPSESSWSGCWTWPGARGAR